MSMKTFQKMPFFVFYSLIPDDEIHFCAILLMIDIDDILIETSSVPDREGLHQ